MTTTTLGERSRAAGAILFMLTLFGGIAHCNTPQVVQPFVFLDAYQTVGGSQPPSPVRRWGPAEKEFVEEVLRAVARAKPGLTQRATAWRPIRAYRVSSHRGFSAFVLSERNELFITDRFFFEFYLPPVLLQKGRPELLEYPLPADVEYRFALERSIGAMQIIFHEMVHLADRFDSLALSYEWGSLIRPRMDRFAQRCIKEIGLSPTAIANLPFEPQQHRQEGRRDLRLRMKQLAREEGLPGVYAATNIKEALTEVASETMARRGYVPPPEIAAFVHRHLLSAPYTPSASDFACCRALERLEQKNYLGAYLALTQAIQANPRNVWAYLERAELALSLKQVAISSPWDDIDRALEYRSAWDWRPYQLRAFFLARDYKLPAAIEDVTAALRLSPMEPTLLQMRASLRIELHQPEAALSDISLALKQNPRDGTLHRLRGQAQMGLGHYSRALSDLDWAIRFNPNDPLAHGWRAWIRASCPDETIRDGAQAVQDATTACELSRWQDAFLIAVLAAAHAESGAFDEAVIRQREAITLASPQQKKAFQPALDGYLKGQPYRMKTIVGH
ncbi:MAG: hypothetical protein U0840_15705 [Gemmataceae bacterium]